MENRRYNHETGKQPERVDLDEILGLKMENALSATIDQRVAERMIVKMSSPRGRITF